MSATNTTHRGDAEIFADARFALDNQPTVPGTVHVHVNDGIVTLTGTVRRPGERNTAERVVRRLDGVRQVIDLITVWELGVFGADEPER